MCPKTPSIRFLTTTHRKVKKITSFNFALILCIYVYKNSINPVSYKYSQGSKKKNPVLNSSYLVVYMSPKTHSIPILTMSHRNLTKKNQF